MSIGVATSFATTLVQYFSPTKSPFYPIVALTVTALLWAERSQSNWWIFFWPLVLVLVVATTLAFMNRPEFDEAEYNDQIKFARAVGVSSGVLCLAWIAVEVAPYEAQANYHYWMIYVACVLQVAVLLLYTFVYYDKQILPATVNFVQLALITSTFIIAATYAAIQYHEALGPLTQIYNETTGETQSAPPFAEVPQFFTAGFGAIFLVVMLGWLATMALWFNHLRKVFRFTINPADIRPRASANVVMMTRGQSGGDQKAG